MEVLSKLFLANVKCGGTAAQDSQSEANEGALSAVATHDLFCFFI